MALPSGLHSPNAQILPRAYYLNTNVVDIAQSLVGKILLTNIDGVLTTARIVETEAYRGSDDKGCHAYIHGLTDRTAPMFCSGGISYVYICYGIHHMINVVTNTEGHGDAVLIRAVHPIDGLQHMQYRRSIKHKGYHLSGGPGKVCQCMGINSSHNYTPYYDINSPVQIWDDGYTPLLVATPRVGMSVRVAEYANKPWRFYEENNPFVSRPLKLHYQY